MTKNYIKATFLFFCALLLWAPAMQGQWVLLGRVTNKQGQGIEFANVLVQSPHNPYGTTCDEQGYYSIKIRETDSVEIRFSALGYEPTLLWAVDKPGKGRLNVTLRPAITQLQEVEVREHKSNTSTFTAITPSRIENAVGPSGGVESLIKTLPDVSSNNELSSQYSVRGGAFDENMVYINRIEIFRPILVRNGQQEGQSIINPDMVDFIEFSPGGFDATYGDKMSSVLDITYSRPRHFAAKASVSFLGATAHAEGLIGDRFTYSVGFRRHSNQYLFRSLETKGTYNTAYTDVQSVLSYRITPTLTLSALALWVKNDYNLIPETQTTTFGSFYKTLELDVYFDGEERDGYTTKLGGLVLDWKIDDDMRFTWTTSAQQNNESERYDIQSQYWLYELGMGADGSKNKFDRGVGTFLEHARNTLSTDIFSSDLTFNKQMPLGAFDAGVRIQVERIWDQVREWLWLDSAGYTMPHTSLPLGNAANQPEAPLFQRFCVSKHQLTNLHLTEYLQRQISWVTDRQSELDIKIGLRGHFYTAEVTDDVQHGKKDHFFFSPRGIFSYHPHWKENLLFRTAAGIYNQSPLYREYRLPDGSLYTDVPPQQSYQVQQTVDWNFSIREKPFRLTADVYYKYLTHVIPYSIDNLRVQYDATQEAVAYATGLSLRLNGEFVKGLESWASLSLLRTQEDIQGDGLGWLDRPTDQRFSAKVFLQDYLPDFEWWRMSISIIYGTGTPITFPYTKGNSSQFRLPAYFRIDWGNTASLNRMKKLSHLPLWRTIQDIQVGLEVFNLFNYRNVASYLWVADYSGAYYPVPNFLTARQVNAKFTILF